MAMIFSDKQALEQSAARCVGLLRALAEDPCRLQEDLQRFFEIEYIALYAMLQDLAFNADGQINWLLPTAMMAHSKVDVYKSDLGIIVAYGNDVSVEVASKLEAKRIEGTQVFYDMPSRLRELSGKEMRIPTQVIQSINENRSVCRA